MVNVKAHSVRLGRSVVREIPKISDSGFGLMVQPQGLLSVSKIFVQRMSILEHDQNICAQNKYFQ